MPRNDQKPPVTSPFRKKIGIEPVTLFLDAEDAIRVSVLQKPEGAGMERVLTAFGRACHEDFPVTAADPRVWEDVAAGKALWQNAETLEWNLLIEGIDRITSHQLVRARVGVTFSQQCTGDRDCRNDVVLVPRAYAQERWSERLDSFIKDAHRAKIEYARDVDAGMCVGEARRRLPQSLSTFIYVKCNLMSLSNLLSRRDDPMSQDWLTMTMAQRIRAAVLEASPWAAPALAPRTSAAGSWYDKVKENGWSCTHLWSPKDSIYDNYEWNPDTFAHGDQSHAEVSSNPGETGVLPELWDGEDAISPDHNVIARLVGYADCRRRLIALGMEDHAALLAACYSGAGRVTG
jgi:hypothetical protein